MNSVPCRSNLPAYFFTVRKDVDEWAIYVCKDTGRKNLYKTGFKSAFEAKKWVETNSPGWKVL